MSVKLAPHFQTLPKWAYKVQFPGAWLKIMDPGAGISQRFPGKRIVGRWYVKDEGQYIARGAAGADDYYNLLAPKYEECATDLAVIECVNEPGCQTIAQIEQLGSFLARWVRLMHVHGYVVAVPAFSVGNPPVWVISAMQSVWDATDYVSAHEYGIRRMDEEWQRYTSLRHRGLLDSVGKPLLITETGIDRGGDGYRKKPGQTSWPEYRSQLFWYEDRLQEDDCVEAAFLFTSGATGTWRSFEVGEAEWRDLAKVIR